VTHAYSEAIGAMCKTSRNFEKRNLQGGGRKEEEDAKKQTKDNNE